MFSEIMKFMKKQKEATAGQISASVGIERAKVEMALTELWRMGKLTKMTRSETCHCSGCAMCSCGEDKSSEVYIYHAEFELNQQKQKSA